MEHNENTFKKRIKLGKKKQAPSSPQVVTKKILPNRFNRGARMKELQGNEQQGDNELYDLIFAEGNSDEEFNPSSQSVLSDESNRLVDQESVKDAENIQQESPKIKKKNRKEDEEIFDLDMIDLDMIDELEDRRDRGEDEEEPLSESISESEEIKKKKKKKVKAKAKKEYEDDLSDDESLNKKRNRINIKKPIKHKFKKQATFQNNNVTFTDNYKAIIINKSILEGENCVEQDEELMLYNDEKYSIAQNIEEENRKTKNIIKKFNTQTAVSAPKYTYMQEKLSQKELLLEAIFTEYYNIQSLQEMQRLEDLNKKEMSTPGKKQFAEFVRIKRGSEVNNTSLTFSNSIVYDKIFEGFRSQPVPKEKKICVITGQPAKYFDPLTNQPYANMEAFKILRERYFQKEEDALLYRIQTLSDLASQKKEKLKKYLLTEGAHGNTQKNNINDMMSLVNKYGILKSEGAGDNEKRIVSHRIYNRNRENCFDSGMLIEANRKHLIICKKIFKDKYSNKGNTAADE